MGNVHSGNMWDGFADQFIHQNNHSLMKSDPTRFIPTIAGHIPDRRSLYDYHEHTVNDRISICDLTPFCLDHGVLGYMIVALVAVLLTTAAISIVYQRHQRARQAELMSEAAIVAERGGEWNHDLERHVMGVETEKPEPPPHVDSQVGELYHDM